MRKILLVTVIANLVFANLKSSAQICFNPVTSYDITAASATSMCSADFNGDGKIDFATANSDGIAILLQDASGGYSNPLNGGLVPLSSSICTTDFNNDGIADLISFNYGPGIISILEGTGSGSFNLLTNINTGTFIITANVCAADFNNDGNTDFALSSGFNFLRIALGAGNGTFGALTNIATGASIIGSMIAADFNNDGNIDLASRSVVVLGDGLGGFNSSVYYNGTAYLLSIVCDDFNEDGKLDIAAANYGTGITGDVAIYLGNGLGAFTSGGNFGIGDSTIPPNSGNASLLISSGDFNGDAHIDLAVGTFKSGVNYTSAATLLEGDGAGNFGMPVNFNVPNLAHAIIAADIDANGKMDLAVLTRDVADTSKLSVLLNCDVTGIAQNETMNTFFQAYPNPGTGVFRIDAMNSIEEVIITDALGKVVLASTPYQKSLELKLDCAGIYFVRIKSMDKISTQKLIVNN